MIFAEGPSNSIENFIKDIPQCLPEASSLHSLEVSEVKPQGFSDFSIVKSQSISDEVTEVSPDIAVCKACLDDMKSQPHRKNYAFTNCTNCGPRFTIIKGLPYDRPKTTMSVFPLCNTCHKEYSEVLDRRFHAQPVACNTCGPQYTLHYHKGIEMDINAIIKCCCQMLEQGKILAIKGLGGYHLCCDASNEEAVKRLRQRKNREGKPLAVMLKDSDAAEVYLEMDSENKKLLNSWRKPIVLLPIRKELAASISIGLSTAGAMLPYMPFHHMLFEKLQIPAVVFTSGNVSDEPIVIDNDEALEKLATIADAVLTYNRDIHNRTDDSVAMIVDDKPRLIRRSRSYAPAPVHLSISTEGIFAAGAELVNCFAIGKGNQAILSQHIGDLKNLETLDFYTESVARFQELFRFTPELIAADMHPEYLSSKFAADLGIKTTLVQHHHAHIASCMAEHHLDEQVIGISFDGTGYGDDGHIWGAEFFVCDLADYERINHFEYVPQPGGDALSKHPWRMMLAYLYHYHGSDCTSLFPAFFENTDTHEREILLTMLKQNINCPLTSSAGRLFDAVSALLGICLNTAYHAEAPMRLEAVAIDDTEATYPYSLGKSISFKECFSAMIDDIRIGIPVAEVATKFHNTIVDVVVQMACDIRENRDIHTVVMSGGSFQNRFLLEKVSAKLKEINFAAFSQEKLPSNDGGIALGQLAIAAKRRELGLI